MRYSLWFLFLCTCVVTQQSSCSFVRERTHTCQSNSTVKGHTLIVQHEKPSPLHGHPGTVVIKATVLPSSIKGISTCKWIFNVDGSTEDKRCNNQNGILKGSSVEFKFKEPGLKTVKVTANFFKNSDKKLLRNCTFINVTGRVYINYYYIRLV